MKSSKILDFLPALTASQGTAHTLEGPAEILPMNTIQSCLSVSDFNIRKVKSVRLESDPVQIALSVSLEHSHISDKMFFGIMDRTNERGIAVSIHPATGEVGDLINGGGVIGYLSTSLPLRWCPTAPFPATSYSTSSARTASATSGCTAKPSCIPDSSWKKAFRWS